MPRKILLFLTVAGIVLSLSCTWKKIELINRRSMILGKYCIDVGYPKGWTVDYTVESKTESGSIVIGNNKKPDSGDSIEFDIYNNDEISDVGKDSWGYQRLQNSNLTFEFAKFERIWFDGEFSSFRSRTYGVIKIDGVAVYGISFRYLPDDEISQEVKAILMDISIK